MFSKEIKLTYELAHAHKKISDELFEKAELQSRFDAAVGTIRKAIVWIHEPACKSIIQTNLSHHVLKEDESTFGEDD